MGRREEETREHDAKVRDLKKQGKHEDAAALEESIENRRQRDIYKSHKQGWGRIES